MKFEEAYNCADDKIYSLDELVVFNQNKEFEIIENLACPFCRQAVLVFVNAENPYLRTMPNSIHEDDCIFEKDTNYYVEFSSFINEENSVESVEKQMYQIAKKLFDTSKHINNSSHNTTSSAELKTKNKYSNTITSFRLPIKRIDLNLDDRDINCLKIFYGKVRISYSQGKNDTLRLYKIDEPDKFICGINITEKVAEHLDFNYKNFYKAEKNIIVTSELTVTNKGYLWTTLKRSNFLQIF